MDGADIGLPSPPPHWAQCVDHSPGMGPLSHCEDRSRGPLNTALHRAKTPPGAGDGVGQWVKAHVVGVAGVVESGKHGSEKVVESHLEIPFMHVEKTTTVLAIELSIFEDVQYKLVRMNI